MNISARGHGSFTCCCSRSNCRGPARLPRRARQPIPPAARRSPSERGRFPTSRATTRAFPDFPSDYEGRVQRGEYLRALMPLDDAQAARQNGGVPVASRFQDPDVAARWGWTLETAWYPYTKKLAPLHTKLLDSAFADPAFPVDETRSGVYYHLHDKEFTQTNGEEGEVGRPVFLMSAAPVYSNVVNPRAGAFMFDENMSPKHVVKTYGVGTVPALDTLSDMAFLQWVEACRHEGVDPKSLRLMFRAHVTYAPAFHTVVQALKEAGYGRVPGWKYRATITMDTRPGAAVLGSTNGASSAWMLLQHKDVLGVKKITEAVVWGYQPRLRGLLGKASGFSFDASPGSAALNIRFTVEDA
ncbi:hypothetical protein C8034_v010013 [Colletotrichum sidae]|uniref:WWE domain-containing protein n=1 Tax=Colletotrichum sidae TaxID=1347389 RepID=A0A4R8T1H9_9PEZI|nr:hypothetical protein C8034_v010013 [Colletotrichum sidae]